MSDKGSERQRLVEGHQGDGGSGGRRASNDVFSPVDHEAGRRRSRRLGLGIAVACCLGVGISLAIALPLATNQRSADTDDSNQRRAPLQLSLMVIPPNSDQQQQQLLVRADEGDLVNNQTGSDEPDQTTDREQHGRHTRWWTTTTVSTDNKPVAETTTTWHPWWWDVFTRTKPASNSTGSVTISTPMTTTMMTSTSSSSEQRTSTTADLITPRPTMMKSDSNNITATPATTTSTTSRKSIEESTTTTWKRDETTTNNQRNQTTTTTTTTTTTLDWLPASCPRKRRGTRSLVDVEYVASKPTWYELMRIQTFNSPAYVEQVSCSTMSLKLVTAADAEVSLAWEEGALFHRQRNTAKLNLHREDTSSNDWLLSVNNTSLSNEYDQLSMLAQIDNFLMVYECYPNVKWIPSPGYVIRIYSTELRPSFYGTRVSELLLAIVELWGLNPSEATPIRIRQRNCEINIGYF